MIFKLSVIRVITALAVCVAGGAASAKISADPQPNLTTATYDNWLLVCHDDHRAKVCEVDQNVVDKQGRPVMRLRVGRIEQKSHNLTVVVQLPIDIAVGRPIEWQVGNVKVPLELRACVITSCFADGRLSEKTLTELERQRKTAKAQFNMTRANGAPITLPLSFNGFIDAWRASQEK